MDGRVKLEQQLWEFVYELLPEDEAEALRGRIAAEPDVARLHDDVRRKAAIVAQAAKLELPSIPLVQPAAPVQASPRRWANWAVGLAASLLACYLGFADVRTRSLERSVADAASGAAWADQPVRTVVFGPTAVQPAQANYFAVRTQTAAGAPRAAAVDYRVLDDDGTLLTSGQIQSDASGFAQFDFLAATPSGPRAARQPRNVSLELQTQTALQPVMVRRTLPLATPQLTTYLSVDKTVYRPGEQVRGRSVTLDRASLEAIREVPVEFRVLDSGGQPLGGAGREVLTQQGVAAAEFELPRFQPGGTYTLVASSPTDAFPEARRDFAVRPYLAPSLRQRLDFARDSYDPGDEVEAELRVEQADGGPARQVPLAIAAEAGGVTFYTGQAATDEGGTHRVRFRLPDQLAADDAVLSVTAGNEGKNRLSEPIPIRQGGVDIEFRPEAGELVPGVANRVYFFAHDALDKPVHIQGRVVDDQGRQLVSLQTIHDGRGVFEFQPEPAQTYRLELDPGSGPVDRPELPPVSQRQFLTLNAAPGVFAAGQPLKIRLLSNAIRPVAVSAVCRGVVVGQELVSPAEFSRHADPAGMEVVIPVADTAEGVVRLTAYDYGVQPPQPVAERLVFRRPTRKLEIQSGQDVGRRRPGESVEWAFLVKNERGRPLPAVLGASVVDEAALSLARDRSASLSTHFWLTGQIEDVRGLEDANLCLAEGPQAEQALDLLLGTQGWRRFVSVPANQLAQVPLATQAGPSAYFDQDSLAAGTFAVADSPAVLIDNAADASTAVRSSLAALQTAYDQTVRRVALSVILGSLVLAVALGLLAVIRRLPARPVWMPALGASAVSLLLGFAWLATESRPGREVAQAPATRTAGEVQVAQGQQYAAPGGMGAVPSPAGSEMGKADSQATNRWYQVENVVGKGAGMAGASPRPAEPSAAEDFASPAVDRLGPPPPAARAEKRKDSEFDKARWDASELDRADESQAVAPQSRSLPDLGQQADQDSPQDMPVPESRMPSGTASRPLARDPSPARGAVDARASSDKEQSESARRLRGAPLAVPPPAPATPPPAPAVPAPAPVRAKASDTATESPGRSLESAQAPLVDQGHVGRIANPSHRPPEAVQAPSAPQAAPPMPAAAPAFGMEAAEKPVPEASVEAIAGTLPKAAAPSQMGLNAPPGSAAGGLPAVPLHVVPETLAESGGSAGGMGGAGARFGGGASAAKPADARQSLAELKQQAEAIAAPPTALPAAPIAEPAPAKFAEAADPAAKRESLARDAAVAAPTDSQLFFRQYGTRELAELSAEQRSASAETVCWEPLLVTDAEGRASLRFRLPETATTYRVLVDGHAQGRIGSYLGRIVVQPESKPGAD